MGNKVKKIKASPAIVRWAAFLTITMAVLWGFSKHIVNFVKTSDYFLVKEIWYESSLRFMESNEITGLKGKNIFDVDLSKVERQLQLRYPQFAQLRVLRRFPNQILVVARERMPFVQAELEGKIVTLDDKGVILAVNEPLESQLPYISGASALKKRITTGMLVEDLDIQLSLKIIKSCQMDRVLRMYHITKMDISNLSQISFYILDNLKIIMDQERFLYQLRMLNLVLSQAKIDSETVKYIDLRFKEPILGKK